MFKFFVAQGLKFHCMRDAIKQNESKIRVLFFAVKFLKHALLHKFFKQNF